MMAWAACNSACPQPQPLSLSCCWTRPEPEHAFLCGSMQCRSCSAARWLRTCCSALSTHKHTDKRGRLIAPTPFNQARLPKGPAMGCVRAQSHAAVHAAMQGCGHHHVRHAHCKLAAAARIRGLHSMATRSSHVRPKHAALGLIRRAQCSHIHCHCQTKVRGTKGQRQRVMYTVRRARRGRKGTRKHTRLVEHGAGQVAPR